MKNITQYTGWPSDTSFSNHEETFTPFLSRGIHIDGLQSISDLSVYCKGDSIDISCTKTGNEFSGDDKKCEYVSLPAESYLEGFRCIQKNEHHWLHQISDIQLYLSQFAINLKDSNESSSIGYDISQLPCFLTSRNIHQINIWMNMHSVSSSLHYDGNHNILNVICGEKSVTLFPPSYTHLLAPHGAHTSSANHSTLSSLDVGSSLRSLDGILRVTLSAGDALFIPEGWWHQVTSERGTCAVNIWFRSLWHRLLKNSVMAPYFLRCAAAEILRQHVPSSSLAPGNEIIELNLVNQMSIEEVGKVFARSTIDQMWDVWVPYSIQHKETWPRVLLSLGPSDCHRLASTWETEDSAKHNEKSRGVKELCEQLFMSHDPDRRNVAMQIRNHIICGQNDYLHSVAARTVNRVLGWTQSNDKELSSRTVRKSNQLRKKRKSKLFMGYHSRKPKRRQCLRSV